MGIHGLTKFVAEKAPKAVKEVAPESFIGRTIAVDASLSLYQFMVAIRDSDQFGHLTNSQGETTSHIAGMLTRAIRIIELGMTPTGELAKRKDRKSAAEILLADAKETGDAEKIKKFAGRTVKVTRKHNVDILRLLQLMGIPTVQAPGEAEAQCAALCRTGRCYAVATEDADALCFGSPILMRRLTFSDPRNQKKNTLMMITLQTLLDELKLSMSQFIDFCIFCGCDYCDTIKGVGPAKALKLIQDYNNIEAALEYLPEDKYPRPERFEFQEARRFFVKPDILDSEDTNVKREFQLGEVDEEGLRKFLIDENQFDEKRVENAIARLKKGKFEVKVDTTVKKEAKKKGRKK